MTCEKLYTSFNSAVANVGPVKGSGTLRVGAVPLEPAQLCKGKTDKICVSIIYGQTRKQTTLVFILTSSDIETGQDHKTVDGINGFFASCSNGGIESAANPFPQAD